MHRINTSNVAPDLFGAGKDGFRNGNKALGISATDFNAEFCNSVQEELANVIEPKFPLNINNRSQLLTAISMMIAEAVNGGDYKASVRVATTVAINLAAPGATIDDAVMVVNDRFLDKDNATLADRGVYVWNGAAVPATRALDADTGAEFNGGAIIPVEQGTVNADTNWQITNDGVVTIGVTGLTFAQVGAQQSMASIQGAYKNIKGSSTGTNAVVTYTIDELVTGDGAGNYLTTRGWNDTITMTLAGAGGLDAGAVAANTWYNVFGITKDDGTKALIASLSAAAPALPVGYTKWALLSAFKTDNTANKYPLGFIQHDARMQNKVAPATNITQTPVMASGSTGGAASAVAVGAFVPSIATRIQVVGSLITQGGYLGVGPSANYSVGGTTNPPPVNGQSDSSTGSVFGNADGEFELESSNIYWWSSGASNLLQCVGWVINI